MPCKVEQTNEPDHIMEAPKRPKENPGAARDLGWWRWLGGLSQGRQGGQGGKRMVGVGVDVGGCSVPAEDSRRGTKGYVPGSLVVHAGLGCRCYC